MKTVYKDNYSKLKELEFSVDWLGIFGIILLSKAYVPAATPFWFVTDAELEALGDTPIDAWEVSGEPDGVGGLTEDDKKEYDSCYATLLKNSGSEQYEVKQ